LVLDPRLIDLDGEPNPKAWPVLRRELGEEPVDGAAGVRGGWVSANQ
jgi:hypothetical protein